VHAWHEHATAGEPKAPKKQHALKSSPSGMKKNVLRTETGAKLLASAAACNICRVQMLQLAVLRAQAATQKHTALPAYKIKATSHSTGTNNNRCRPELAGNAVAAVAYTAQLCNAMQRKNAPASTMRLAGCIAPRRQAHRYVYAGACVWLQLPLFLMCGWLMPRSWLRHRC
jgi:hypothetical protein